jgi:hypothetical protein
VATTRSIEQREEERQLLENRKELEREKAHLEQFVRRFRAKASKGARSKPLS